MRSLNRYLVACLMVTTMAFGTFAPSTAEAKKAKKPPQAAAIFDASKRKRTRHQINEYFSVSLYANFSHLAERDRIRDDGVRDRMDQTELLLGFVGRVQLTDRIMAFVHAETSLEDRKTHLTRGRLTDPQLKEALIAIDLSDATTLSFGRLRLSDKHRWVADASVDGVHLSHRVGGHIWEVAAFTGTRTVSGDYLMVHFGHADVIKRWGVIALAEQDAGADRFHLHGYYSRKVSDRFSYTANLGAVFGDAQNGQNAGVGFDVRAIRKLGTGKLNPQLTLGFAFGSKGFAQTGLHTNKTYDGGQFQFHRYGYVYQAELTNLAALQVGIGVRPSRKFSADLLVSAYAQPSLSTIGPDARINGITTGASRFLGHEISLVAAWRPRKNVKVEAGIGRFKPGPAYVDRSTATRAFARISIQF